MIRLSLLMESSRDIVLSLPGLHCSGLAGAGKGIP